MQPSGHSSHHLYPAGYGGLSMTKLLRKHKTKPSCNQSSSQVLRARRDRFTSAKHVPSSGCVRGSCQRISGNFLACRVKCFQSSSGLENKQMYLCIEGRVCDISLLGQIQWSLFCSQLEFTCEEKILPNQNKKLWSGRAKEAPNPHWVTARLLQPQNFDYHHDSVLLRAQNLLCTLKSVQIWTTK